MLVTVAERAWSEWGQRLLARDQIERLVLAQVAMKYSGDSIDWFLIGVLCASYGDGTVN